MSTRSELNATVIAHLILDYDKTLNEIQVMDLAKRVMWASEEFAIGYKEAFVYVTENPQWPA